MYNLLTPTQQLYTGHSPPTPPPGAHNLHWLEFLLTYVPQDMEGAMSATEVSNALGLSALKSRTWSIFKTSAVKGEGLDEAMEWLVFIPYVSCWIASLYYPFHSWAQKVHSPNLLKRKCISKVVRICIKIIFHLSKLWKAKFSLLCDVIFLVGLERKFDIDHSQEWKGYCTGAIRCSFHQTLLIQHWCY